MRLTRQLQRSLGGLRDELIIIGDDAMRERETISANGKVGPRCGEYDVRGLTEGARAMHVMRRRG